MKALQMTAKHLAAIGILILLMVAPARGQAETALTANVPFSFEAGGKSFPAGTYQLKFQLTEQFLVISDSKSAETKLHFIAQLAGASLFKDTGLVFDVSQGRHTLAEVWIPGQGGVLLKPTQKQHSHEVVMAVVSGPSSNLSGKKIFERTCARCHGPDGKGNPAANAFFKTQVPRLDSKYVQSKSNAELAEIISHGRRMMDPVREGQASVQHLLYPDSVEAVIRYVRTLKP